MPPTRAGTSPARPGGATTRPAGTTRFTRPQWGAIWLLLCCQSLMILDTSGLNVALTAIGRDLGVPVDQIGIVNMGFVVTLAAMIPLSGWLGERFGTVRVLVGALTVVVVGSLICASAVSLPMVVTGRVVQGMGSGGLVPLASALLFRNFVPTQRLRVMAALSLPISLAPALGPAVGGLVVDTLSWRWVFLLNLPISVTAIVVGLVFAREVENRAVRSLDTAGAVLTLIGFAATVFGVERLATGADITVGAASLAIGIAALSVLIPLQKRKGEHAFLDVNLFRRRIFAKTTTITAAHSVGFMGFGLAGPLLLQTQLGISAFEAGLVGVAGAFGPILSGRIARRLIMRMGPRPTIVLSQSGILLGLGVIVLGYAVLTMWVICVGAFIYGASSLLTIMTCQTVGFAAVPPQHLGDATALDGTSRQVGNALGIATVSGALAAAGALEAPMLAVVAMTFGALALFHVLALLVLASRVRLPVPSDDGPPEQAP
jgi:EmrB/QacA subfamily drug resistance transporter